MTPRFGSTLGTAEMQILMVAIQLLTVIITIIIASLLGAIFKKEVIVIEQLKSMDVEIQMIARRKVLHMRVSLLALKHLSKPEDPDIQRIIYDADRLDADERAMEVNKKK